MILMKLGDLINIKSLDFDLLNRKLTVYHHDNYDRIFQRLDSLKFDTIFIESVSVDRFIFTDIHRKERILLWKILAINFFFFALEILTGFIENSMGLVADSLDMLVDSIVYDLPYWLSEGQCQEK